MRVGLSAVYRCPRQRLHRVHHIDRNSELGLETLAHGAGSGFELVDVVGHRTGIRKKAPLFFGEPWIARGAIEELYAKLRFQIRQRLAYDGLRAAQLAPRG